MLTDATHLIFTSNGRSRPCMSGFVSASLSCSIPDSRQLAQSEQGALGVMLGALRSHLILRHDLSNDREVGFPSYTQEELTFSSLCNTTMRLFMCSVHCRRSQPGAGT
jgi:hypothetical protein